jgi:hypothetical protein
MVDESRSDLGSMIQKLGQAYMAWVAIKVFFFLTILAFFCAPIIFNVLFGIFAWDEKYQIVAQEITALNAKDDASDGYNNCSSDTDLIWDTFIKQRAIEDETSYWGQHEILLKCIIYPATILGLILIFVYFRSLWKHKALLIPHIAWCVFDTVAFFTYAHVSNYGNIPLLIGSTGAKIIFFLNFPITAIMILALCRAAAIDSIVAEWQSVHYIKSYDERKFDVVVRFNDRSDLIEGAPGFDPSDHVVGILFRCLVRHPEEITDRLAVEQIVYLESNGGGSKRLLREKEVEIRRAAREAEREAKEAERDAIKVAKEEAAEKERIAAIREAAWESVRAKRRVS